MRGVRYIRLGNRIALSRHLSLGRLDRYIARLLIAGASGTIVVMALGIFAVKFAFTTPRVLPIAGAPYMSDRVDVTISGRIYNLGDNLFLIKDATGRAEVETCPSWFRRILLRDGEQVSLTGEILRVPPASKEAKYRIAAYRIERQGMPTIVLRKTIGRPPWVRSAYVSLVR